jgi:hypothetical protein
MIKETVLLIYLINDDDRVELVGVIPGLAKAGTLMTKNAMLS